MKTRPDELPLGDGRHSTASKPRRNRNTAALAIKPVTQTFSEGGPGYASAFWLCNLDPDEHIVRLTIGWAMKEHGRFHRSGAWSLRREVPAQRTRLSNILFPVEEPHGALFHKPTRIEEDLNAHSERLLADWLLFLTHRLLFGQCQALDDRIPRDNVNLLLLFGPALPKFVGRLCYSNYHRDKTVAILAPTVRIGESPEQSTADWEEEPFPRYCHDCAQRRWTTKNGGTGVAPRVSSFDLVEPTGDSVPGKITLNFACGPVKWIQKAKQIQSILDSDVAEVRLAIWRNRAVNLPHGLKEAAVAAVLNHDLDKCVGRSDRIKETLNRESLKLLQGYENQLNRLAMNIGGLATNVLLRDTLRAHARLKFIKELQWAEAEGRSLVNDPPDGRLMVKILDELGQNLGKSVRPEAPR